MSRGFAQGRGQLPPQAFAGHLQDVRSGLARSRFQVPAAAAVDIEDIAVLVDQDRDRGVLLQEGALGQLTQRAILRAGSLRKTARRAPPPDFLRGNEGQPQGRAARRLASVQLRLAVLRREKVVEFTHGLGGAQKEAAVRVQGVMEQGDKLLLQHPVHVDQQVAATEQVELGERRVLEHVLLGEDDHVADAFMDAVAAAGLLDEEARQPMRRDVGDDVGGVGADAGLRDGAAVDVRGEHLNL